MRRHRAGHGRGRPGRCIGAGIRGRRGRRFGEYAAVIDDDDAAVILGADQAAKALAEAQDGFGDHVLVEGVLEGLAAGGDDRVRGTSKGSLVMATTERESPGTSTPSQKERVPSRMAASAERNISSRALGEAPSPCS